MKRTLAVGGLAVAALLISPAVAQAAVDGGHHTSAPTAHAAQQRGKAHPRHRRPDGGRPLRRGHAGHAQPGDATSTAATSGRTTCPTHCVPKPTPPKGGWPCLKTHTCKPPKPHCPPVVKHPKPKPPWHAHPGKPIVGHPAPKHPLKPHARVRVADDVTPTALPKQLPFTASVFDLGKYAEFGAGGLGSGVLLVVVVALTGRPRKVTKQIRGVL